MFVPLIALLTPLACGDAPTAVTIDPDDVLPAEAAYPSPGGVPDLAVSDADDSSAELTWTQIDDGTGMPARYQVKYATTSIKWRTAALGCEPVDASWTVGAPLSCTVEGLDPDTDYEFLLMSYRLQGNGQAGTRYSNIATGATTAADTTVTDTIPTDTIPADTIPTDTIPTDTIPTDTIPTDTVPTDTGHRGIWVSSTRLEQLPTSGPGWENVLATANGSCGTVDLSNQDQMTNVCVMAKALVFARTGEAQYRADVVNAIEQIVSAPTYDGRALALGRELGAYVIAADLIGLNSYDPALDESFRNELRTLRTTYTYGASSSLIDCHEKRPNNWGAHCGATRVAIAVYLGDDADLDRAAAVFKGYLGDRSAYAGFRYGGPSGEEDLSWQCDPTRPVGVNPVGCTRNGLSLDGVLPDDQRRGGSFTTSPPKENYVWEAMQGLLAQAVLLERAGYDPFEWEDRALLRVARWLHDVNDYPAEGDDTWQAPLLNHVYGTSFPEQSPTRPGKNVGWTDWTHS